MLPIPLRLNFNLTVISLVILPFASARISEQELYFCTPGHRGPHMSRLEWAEEDMELFWDSERNDSWSGSGTFPHAPLGGHTDLGFLDTRNRFSRIPVFEYGDGDTHSPGGDSGRVLNAHELHGSLIRVGFLVNSPNSHSVLFAALDASL